MAGGMPDRAARISRCIAIGESRREETERRSSGKLRAGPEGGRGAGKFEANAGKSSQRTADVDDACFGFEVVVHVGEEEALAQLDGSFKIEGAAGVGEIEGLGLLVEGLMIGAGPVDENEERALGALGGAAVGFGSGGGGRAGGGERVKVSGRRRLDALFLGKF